VSLLGGGSLVHLLVESESAAAHPFLGPLPLGRAHLQVDHGRHQEAKALRDRLQVQRVHVEDLLQLVRVVGPYVRLERLLGRLVEEVVLGDQFLQLK